MLCLDSVALWHGEMDTEGEHYEQDGSIRIDNWGKERNRQEKDVMAPQR